MRRYHARRSRRQEAAELNVTAFMNLMVVLVPFLLVLAVFTRITVHDLNLPGETVASEEVPRLQLEVVVRADRIVLADRERGPLREIGNVDGDYDLATLRESLQRLKAEAPEADRATLRLEPQVDYQSLISVMDTVRGTAAGIADDTPGRDGLFPHVSIGDAPRTEEGGPRA